MGKKKAPKLRFEGFDQDWEQRKLGEVTHIIDTKHATAPISENKSKYKMIRTSSVRHGQLYPLKMDNVTEEVYETWSERIHLQAGDVVFSREAPMGESAVIPSDKNKYFLGQRMVAIRCYESINPYFIVSTFLAPKFRKEINIRNAESTTVANFGISSLKIYKIDLPSIREQTMIGHLFQQLDDTITLHQRKLEQLKLLKQAFLQKLFVNHGFVPELRFADFSEEWEQRKLDDVVKFYSGLTYSPDNVQKEGTFVLRSSNVKNGEIIDADNVYVYHDVVNSDNVQEGDLIVVVRNGSRDLIGKHAKIKQQMENTVIGAFMTGVRSETPDFTNAMLDTQQFAIEISKNLGATINQITTGAFKKMQFVVSKDKDERESIGTFFRSIDDTIALHQKKLTNLKELKKAFLQFMFI